MARRGGFICRQDLYSLNPSASRSAIVFFFEGEALGEASLTLHEN